VNKQLRTVTLNRQQYLRLAQAFEAYERLEHAIGAVKAAEVVRIIYERRVLESNPDGGYILIPEGGTGPEAAALERLLTVECGQIATKLAYVTDLLAAASEGKLRPRLDLDSGGPARFSREEDIRKASAWICQTLHGNQTGIVDALLAEHAVAPQGCAVLGRTPALLDSLHARLSPNSPAHRGTNPETAYPSSTGGRHLLELVFERTSGAVWPLPGDIWWLDVALFYMGAIGTVQGYSDGNKRASRMAYAIILLRARRPFVAPSPELEADLFQMLGPASS
jgi:hypothetical protein